MKVCNYYPFGMPMPNRNTINNKYRYAYQGQEKDPETGKEAFELRLWDSRIGRWLTTDPKRFHHSPYLGMGNNPLNLIDPDGGNPEDPKDARGIKDNNSSAVVTLDEVVLDVKVSDHSRTMNNPIVQAVHRGQRETLRGPGAQAVAGILAIPLILELGAITATEEGSAFLARNTYNLYKRFEQIENVYELGSEIIINRNDLRKVDLSGVIFSGKKGDVVSAFVNVTANGITLNSLDDTAVNFVTGKAIGKVHSGLRGVAGALGDKGAINAMKHIYSASTSIGVKEFTK